MANSLQVMNKRLVLLNPVSLMNVNFTLIFMMNRNLLTRSDQPQLQPVEDHLCQVKEDRVMARIWDKSTRLMKDQSVLIHQLVSTNNKKKVELNPSNWTKRVVNQNCNNKMMMRAKSPNHKFNLTNNNDPPIIC